MIGCARGDVVFAAGGVDATEQIMRGSASRTGCGTRRARSGGRPRCCGRSGRSSGASIERGDHFFYLGERLPIGEAIGPKVSVLCDLTRVVRGHDLGHGHGALVAFTEVDGKLQARGLAITRVVARFGRGFTGRRVDARGIGFAVDDDGGAAFAAPDLRQAVRDFFVCNRVLGSARRTGNLH